MELPIDARTILNLSHGRTAAEPPAPPPGLPWEQLYAAALGQEAYVWGFPWLYLTQICWLWTSEDGKKLAEEEGIKIPWKPMNEFFHSDTLSNPSYQSGGSPNCDTLAGDQPGGQTVTITVPPTVAASRTSKRGSHLSMAGDNLFIRSSCSSE